MLHNVGTKATLLSCERRGKANFSTRCARSIAFTTYSVKPRIYNTDGRSVCVNDLHCKESTTWYRLYPEFCKDHLEDASLHAKSLRLAMEAS